MIMNMNTWFVVVSIVLLLHLEEAWAVGNNASVMCIEKERLSLLSLKQGFVNRDNHLFSWGSGESQKECCNWEGVYCDNLTGHVVGLSLLYYGFEGTISPSLAELHHLRTLKISSNNFNLTQFPSFITSLKELQVLDLSFNNLKGEIPQELGDLSSLQTLVLSSNQLEGGIPKSSALLCNIRYLDLAKNSLSGQIDNFVASFSRNCGDNNTLHVLDLSFNQFSGPLPSFSQLSSLTSLALDFNHLNGTLNDSIGQLSNLQELGISYNSLEGVIYESHFLRLSQVKVLDFSFNHFVFQISPDWIPPFQLAYIYLASCKLGPGFPMWLQTQTSCLVLDISSAGISGTIPSWFWNFPLKLLNVSHNQFTGEIPEELPSTSLQLDYSSNLFEGSIPSNLSYGTITLYLSNNMFTDASPLLCPNMNTSLFVLDLSNNLLSGTLPDCWTHFALLVVLNVANNSFSGKVPTSMGSLSELHALHLGYNRFTGEIPMFLNKCTKLTTLDIVQNNFSGTIPSWIGRELQKLRVLILRSNMFSGSLPSTICDLSQVQILDLSLNNISGSLPKCLNQLSALAKQTNSDASIIYFPLFALFKRDSFFAVDIASLIWKGRESRYQKTLGLVKSIDFSHNMLTGEIPSELMDLVGLVALNISRNMISGKIPTAIGQLKSLDFLDLSRNHLFGRIPSQLSQIDRLSVMDLSYNNLSGKIPIGTQLQSFDPSAYVGNEGLCGDPLPKCSQPKKPTVENKDDDLFFSRGGGIIELQLRSSCMEELPYLICFVVWETGEKGYRSTLRLIYFEAFALLSLSLSTQSQPGFKLYASNFLLSCLVLAIIKQNFMVGVGAAVLCYIAMNSFSYSDSRRREQRRRGGCEQDKSAVVGDCLLSPLVQPSSSLSTLRHRRSVSLETSSLSRAGQKLVMTGHERNRNLEWLVFLNTPSPTVIRHISFKTLNYVSLSATEYSSLSRSEWDFFIKALRHGRFLNFWLPESPRALIPMNALRLPQLMGPDDKLF
ncbi:hypothetical protein K1719_003660 [Acacia pycnantha]|nr:hypothetical protein K1719_003660 [Acacia pycnantha]